MRILTHLFPFVPYICTRNAAKGGVVLITIKFSNRADCEAIYTCLHEHIQTGEYEAVFGISVRRPNSKQLVILSGHDRATYTYVFQPMFAKVVKNYIITRYEQKWIHELLEKKFFFTDNDERNAISSLCYLIMNGKKSDLPNLNQLQSREHAIEEAMLSLLVEGFDNEFTFSFDAFIQFRLREYKECLRRYLEIAIDEYKLEQEYQSFIENLRAFLHRRQPVINTIIVLYNKKPIFYDQNLRLINQAEITAALRSSGFFFSKTMIESSLLQPLLALAPTQIKLFSDLDESGILYTLKNIFQERITFYSLQELGHIQNLPVREKQ